MSRRKLILSEGSAFDIGAVMDVMDVAFDPAFGEAWTAQQCLGLLGMPGIWLTIARLGGDAAGFALGRAVADEAELLLIGVSPDYRRQGIGKALLDDTRNRAKGLGAARLHLEVRHGNPAVELYNQAGFVQAGRRREYYRGADGSVFDALSLSISLI